MSPGSGKCIVLLSAKSSGSTALQNFLTRIPGVRAAEYTRHMENETLYWMKAAAILDRPQVELFGSEIPFEKGFARRDLVDFLTGNLESFSPPEGDEDLVFGGWKRLCERYAPVFLEKSPHHLHQWSALELILECVEKFPEVDFLLIGLVRNPMDMLYSAWDRWRTPPEINEPQWRIAHENLARLRDLAAGRLVVVRYEDIIRDVSTVEPVFEFIGRRPSPEDAGFFHGRSLARWKDDRWWGFRLGEETVRLAENLGYPREDLESARRTLWPAYRLLSRTRYRVMTPLRARLGRMKRRILGGP